MPPSENIALTPDQLCLLEQVAAERGISVEEAATQLHREALAKVVQQGTGRRPARIYTRPLHEGVNDPGIKGVH